MMTKHRVFYNRLSCAKRLEEIPKVRLHLVPGNTAIADSLKCRLLAGSRIVLLDPDVAEVFTTPESVNSVLRALLATMPSKGLS